MLPLFLEITVLIIPSGYITTLHDYPYALVLLSTRRNRDVLIEGESILDYCKLGNMIIFILRKNICLSVFRSNCCIFGCQTTLAWFVRDMRVRRSTFSQLTIVQPGYVKNG